MRLLGKDTCKIFNANTFAEDLAVDLKTINKNDQY